ncbi:uncharacterized protein LOC120652077 isoform X3 [Panicum virgatum]|uniref:uncharacterized protein LOC120652077 isoform X3 n=1 Tax=Panicum virgatum TaxID=38727 RepID=UPI0019D5E73C|nr:uncharacterized protein LOC120652077 isoform X3 [Panicum virgatum]
MKGVPAAANAAAAPVPATKISMPASAAGGAEAALPGKGRYKVWALAAIALLALWSMSAASVSLRWSSSGDLASVYRDLDVPLGDDLDSLETHVVGQESHVAGQPSPVEMEEREKLVGRMWDMYTRISDEVRDAAVAEIARMSAHKLELEQIVNENEEENAASNRGGSRSMGK